MQVPGLRGESPTGFVVQPASQVLQGGRKPLQLIKVQRRERLQPLLSVGRQAYPHEPAIRVQLVSDDEAGRLGAVDEFDRAMRTKQQVFGDLADGRTAAVVVPLHCQEQLVLGRTQACRLCLALAPPLESPQVRAESEQSRKIISA